MIAPNECFAPFIMEITNQTQITFKNRIKACSFTVFVYRVAGRKMVCVFILFEFIFFSQKNGSVFSFFNSHFLHTMQGTALNAIGALLRNLCSRHKKTCSDAKKGRVSQKNHTSDNFPKEFPPIFPIQG